MTRKNVRRGESPSYQKRSIFTSGSVGLVAGAILLYRSTLIEFAKELFCKKENTATELYFFLLRRQCVHRVYP